MEALQISFLIDVITDVDQTYSRVLFHGTSTETNVLEYEYSNSISVGLVEYFFVSTRTEKSTRIRVFELYNCSRVLHEYEYSNNVLEYDYDKSAVDTFSKPCLSQFDIFFGYVQCMCRILCTVVCIINRAPTVIMLVEFFLIFLSH